MRYIPIIFILILINGCYQIDQPIEVENSIKIKSESKELQDSIVAKVFRSEILKTEGVFSTEWQEELNRALEKDSTIAYLWQQKAMPLFKQRKYELGMPFLDKAVKYDEREYLEYRGFMKCIFAKRYKESILDFEEALKKYGNSYVMDHSYTFYIALNKIQLNQFKEAKVLLETEIERQKKAQGEDWVHHLDLFYLGISRYEQNEYEGAIKAFDKALKLYPEFSDAQMYKAICLRKLGQTDEATSLRKIAQKNGKDGYTINEDNAIYEQYPYQIRWN